MIQELFLSGYCRSVDSSRMVAVEIDGGVLCEADCSYPDCPHAPNCQIAQKISDILK